MKRSKFTVKYTDFEKTNQNCRKILEANNFSETNYNNEHVWVKGNIASSFFTSPKYIKIEFSENNTLNIYGWLKQYGLGEMNLDGVVGALPKKTVMKVIQQIIQSVI